MEEKLLLGSMSMRVSFTAQLDGFFPPHFSDRFSLASKLRKRATSAEYFLQLNWEPEKNFSIISR
jgi:hypothetical protein